MKEQIEARVREGHLKPKEGVDLQNFYSKVLHGYTYVDINESQPAMHAHTQFPAADGTQGSSVPAGLENDASAAAPASLLN